MRKILIISFISAVVGITVPVLWVTVINRSRDESFAWVLIWLVYPGYKAAAILFPNLANSESAGFTLLLPAMVIVFVLYFLLTFVLCFLILRVIRAIRG